MQANGGGVDASVQRRCTGADGGGIFLGLHQSRMAAATSAKGATPAGVSEGEAAKCNGTMTFRCGIAN